ncbi:MAG: winged helix-turn-helix domain-containing protein [Lachnospiraceae bacterium]|nr:winged helix-turn-helix domain-containing protein [Lachnospiraceae bacterium]
MARMIPIRGCKECSAIGVKNRILKAYDKNIFQITDHFIKVVFPFAKAINHSGIENGTERILVALAGKPTITIKEMSEQLGFSVRKANRLMKELRENGKITRIGSDRKGSWKINE